jgi:hypothetical protein
MSEAISQAPETTISATPDQVTKFRHSILKLTEETKFVVPSWDIRESFLTDDSGEKIIGFQYEYTYKAPFDITYQSVQKIFINDEKEKLDDECKEKKYSFFINVLWNSNTPKEKIESIQKKCIHHVDNKGNIYYVLNKNQAEILLSRMVV